MSFSKQEDEVIPVIRNAHGISLVEQAATPVYNSNNNDTVINEGSQPNPDMERSIFDNIHNLSCRISGCIAISGIIRPDVVKLSNVVR